jgi:hypothetical protein
VKKVKVEGIQKLKAERSKERKREVCFAHSAIQPWFGIDRCEGGKERHTESEEKRGRRTRLKAAMAWRRLPSKSERERERERDRDRDRDRQ